MTADDDNLLPAIAGLGDAPLPLHPLTEAETELAAGRPREAARLASEHALFGPPLERAESLLIYADAMARLGAPAQATDGYRAALLADPGAYRALHGIAALHRDAGKTGDARAFAEQALRIAASQELGLDYGARPVAALMDDLGDCELVVAILAENGIGPESLVRSWLAHRDDD